MINIDAGEDNNGDTDDDDGIFSESAVQSDAQQLVSGSSRR